MTYPLAKKTAKTSTKLLCLLGAISLTFSSFSQALTIIPSPPEVKAKGHILIDFNTGKVLAESNADALLAPASLTKMMTSYIIGKELASGNINNTDLVKVSEKAWAKNFPGSSLMFIEVGTEVSVELLNQGIIVASGNDACVAMAEHIAGSEGAFAQLMNGHAAQLGMSSSYFENSHGLDSQEHKTTPRDMATLAMALIRDVPEEYKIYSQKVFSYNNIKQYNRNNLLWDKSMNVDGLKTGHTAQAGYSLVSSATKGGMRLVSVVMGTESERARKVESKKLLNYGFRFFETYTPYKAGDKFATNRVWMGDVKEVDLGILLDTPITVPRGQRKNLAASIELDQQLKAPLAKGTVVGKLFLRLDGEDIAEYPLVTLQEVNEGGMFSKLVDYVKLQFVN
ncbi:MULTISPECIES: serine hydrolase [unclassified Colwellia]|jgi:D-alanyl-D-alanine carboxypeptidase (penicillin-binding protein 5/6)|uniref:serine hydrolase n=1 Tax=unclassified Colwellia TaxID=196834 RepID=UPI0015F70BC7|nr:MULTISPECIES: serine hydrolase [unclassified Colwellia]MBA6362503.1 serine hydrolase [Colwellia sp. BRX8-8]MBA6337792.1 serine hydrolase [Colwellia sp. BRX8-7]MBA6355587.1 serine hydrolase [Colwellia sp. BRX8-3]MBA6360476.1 serine hydrolase [Colwellia sp. BRX8-6]MBA6367788.1 serine hydrolase [Colwellia sp. BRX8-5]|tara:strand:- start:2005 stop:3192 length:1188 start_codon:yes stop_codon:yes gene_type:complete